MTMCVTVFIINYRIYYHPNHRDLGSNCLIESDLHYTSSLVSLNSISSIYQKNCPSMICPDSLRSQGCLFCENSSNNKKTKKCISCLEDHILFNGTCVECLSMEVCPFNNTDEVYCLDNNSDLSLCNESDETTENKVMVIALYLGLFSSTPQLTPQCFQGLRNPFAPRIQNL